MTRKLFFLLVITIFLFTKAVYSQAPVITFQTAHPINCVDSTTELKILATGQAPLTYQWFKDSNPVGTNSSTLTLSSLTSTDEATYTCQVSNTVGSVTSDPIDLNVVENPPTITSITTQNDLVCVGTDNLLEVTITGESPNFNWHHDGNILGHTIQYEILNAAQTDEGQYFCVVHNVCGRDTSATIDIDIVEPAHITLQPTTQTICEGEDATFTSQAEGDYLNYSWLEDEVLIVGETDTFLNVINPAYPHEKTYNIVAYNVCNRDTSNDVVVSINTAPVITGQPLDNSECTNLVSTITLNTFAYANTDLNYQWYDENNNPIPNATTPEIEISLIDEDTAHYYCVVSNVCGTVNSDTATITSLSPPVIKAQPTGDTVCVGEDVSMLIKVVGAEPIVYQWLFQGADVNGGNISGETTEQISISAITEGQSGIYSCNVSNVCGAVLSDEVEVLVKTPPLVNSQPQDVEICEGEALNIDFVSSGTEPMTYQWYIIGNSTAIGNTEDYVSNYADPANTGEYYCLLTNACETISTDTIDVTIKALPQITTQPTDESVCEGEYASMSITATGEEPLIYLWYRNGTSVSGQTNSTLEYLSAQVNQTGTYFCRVANSCSYEDSETAELSIGTEPAITWNPVGQTLCEHDTLNLIMDAQGDNFTIQWYHNDTPITGENDTALTILNIDSNMQGEYYCLAYNSCAIVSTDTVEVNTIPAPIMTLGDDIELCEGTDTVIGPIGNYAHYNWNNGLSYQPTLDVHLGGTFILEVTGDNSCKTRDTLIVTYHPYHDILFSPVQISSCGAYTLDAGEGGYQYTWNTTPVQTTSSISITETGTYSVTVTGDAFGCADTESVFVEIKEPISISLGNDLTAPVSGYVDIGVEAIYADYIWSNGYSGPLQSIYGSNYGVGTHEFSLTAVAENGCSDTDTINVTFWDDLGIEDENIKSEIDVYPNPTKGNINIISNNHKIENVHIYNSIGKLLNTFVINNNEISLDISNFKKGIYILKLQCKNAVITKKITLK